MILKEEKELLEMLLHYYRIKKYWIKNIDKMTIRELIGELTINEKL